MKDRARGKNDAQPESDREGINDYVVNDDSKGKTATKRLSNEKRRDNDGVVPDVEDATEHLWNGWGQAGNEQAVTPGGRR